MSSIQVYLFLGQRKMFCQKLLFCLGSLAFYDLTFAEAELDKTASLYNITKDSLSEITAQKKSTFVLLYSDR